ncbi:MAG: hypothetical protein Q9174_001723 [Haloplaca sp. 1 TL-2023]
MDARVHIADDYNQSQMIGLGIVFIILPILAVVLRIWAKLLGPRGIVADDILVFFGLVRRFDSRVNSRSVIDVHPMMIREIDLSKCKFAVNILSTVGLGFTKSSFLLFYMSIFTTKRFRICAQIVLAITVAWTISYFFSNLFTCNPISPYIEPFYHNNCVDGLALWYSMAISDIIVDFFIILLPIPVTLKLQLPLHQRIGVLAMFMLGAA